MSKVKVQLGTNNLPEQQPNVAALLARVGLAECSECLSWYFNTRDAKFFHSRRCGG